ncbi:hypothetical protein FOZ63_023399 [Perkinsus olseni]|uniref:Thioredoxin domain-containing protein n=1 Tax=Perkinsus olseni TaxID=32597 RepID=A0A7J6TGT1_PEROL|nr:hypothetical protein FOZ63_023399 [Perkinsus olseni]KAF4754027.1 hypothetical protein FOZ62_026950 [Perkinsus olseni]
MLQPRSLVRLQSASSRLLISASRSCISAPLRCTPRRFCTAPVAKTEETQQKQQQPESKWRGPLAFGAALGLGLAGLIAYDPGVLDQIKKAMSNEHLENSGDKAFTTLEKRDRDELKFVGKMIPKMEEDQFDDTDNIILVTFNSEQQRRENLLQLGSFIRDLRDTALANRVAEKTSNLENTHFYYAVTPGASPDGKLDFILYKGQRRQKVQLSGEEREASQKVVDEMEKFFQPMSRPLDELPKFPEESPVEEVSALNFNDRVIAAARPDMAILLQMYEDSCFLCFLMRPFVNQLEDTFRRAHLPITIKRLNIEKNDFPLGCPVARGTPTFVLYRGYSPKPEKLAEFRPRDIVDRIRTDLLHEHPGITLSEHLLRKWEGMVNQVSQRFQLLSQLIMWNTELEKSQMVLAGVSSSAPEAVRAMDKYLVMASSGDDKELFTSVVSEIMSADMKRTDLLDENIKYLNKEVMNAEMDALVMAEMMAENVVQLEEEKGEASERIA